MYWQIWFSWNNHLICLCFAIVTCCTCNCMEVAVIWTLFWFQMLLLPLSVFSTMAHHGARFCCVPCRGYLCHPLSHNYWTGAWTRFAVLQRSHGESCWVMLHWRGVEILWKRPPSSAFSSVHTVSSPRQIAAGVNCTASRTVWVCPSLRQGNSGRFGSDVMDVLWICIDYVSNYALSVLNFLARSTFSILYRSISDRKNVGKVLGDVAFEGVNAPCRRWWETWIK